VGNYSLIMRLFSLFATVCCVVALLQGVEAAKRHRFRASDLELTLPDMPDVPEADSKLFKDEDLPNRWKGTLNKIFDGATQTLRPGQHVPAPPSADEFSSSYSRKFASSSQPRFMQRPSHHNSAITPLPSSAAVAAMRFQQTTDTPSMFGPLDSAEAYAPPQPGASDPNMMSMQQPQQQMQQPNGPQFLQQTQQLEPFQLPTYPQESPSLVDPLNDQLPMTPVTPLANPYVDRFDPQADPNAVGMSTPQSMATPTSSFAGGALPSQNNGPWPQSVEPPAEYYLPPDLLTR